MERRLTEWSETFQRACCWSSLIEITGCTGPLVQPVNLGNTEAAVWIIYDCRCLGFEIGAVSPIFGHDRPTTFATTQVIYMDIWILLVAFCRCYDAVF